MRQSIDYKRACKLVGQGFRIAELNHLEPKFLTMTREQWALGLAVLYDVPHTVAAHDINTFLEVGNDD